MGNKQESKPSKRSATVANSRVSLKSSRKAPSTRSDHCTTRLFSKPMLQPNCGDYDLPESVSYIDELLYDISDESLESINAEGIAKLCKSLGLDVEKDV